MTRSEKCVRCKEVPPADNQYLCKDCKRERNRERYKPKKDCKRELEKKCKCGAVGFFLTDKPISNIKIEDLKKIPILCLNCLLDFNKL